MGELRVHGFLYYRVPRGLRTREVRKKVHDAVEEVLQATVSVSR